MGRGRHHRRPADDPAHGDRRKHGGRHRCEDVPAAADRDQHVRGVAGAGRRHLGRRGHADRDLQADVEQGVDAGEAVVRARACVLHDDVRGVHVQHRLPHRRPLQRHLPASAIPARVEAFGGGVRIGQLDPARISVLPPSVARLERARDRGSNRLPAIVRRPQSLHPDGEQAVRRHRLHSCLLPAAVLDCVPQLEDVPEVQESIGDDPCLR